MSHERLYPTTKKPPLFLSHPGDGAHYLASYQAEAERKHGTTVLAPGGQAHVTLFAGEGRRWFAGGLWGSVGVGYIALLRGGIRVAWVQHAFHSAVRAKSVRVPPPGGIVEDAKAVLTMHASEPIRPFTARAPNKPYNLLAGRSGLAPLVDQLVTLCSNPSKVAIVPSSDSSIGPYNHSLVVDIQPDDPLGFIVADGTTMI